MDTGQITMMFDAGRCPPGRIKGDVSIFGQAKIATSPLIPSNAINYLKLSPKGYLMLNKKIYAVYLSLSLYTVPFQGCRPGPRQESQAAISQTEPSVNKDVVPLQDFNPKSSYVGIEVRTADNWYLQINEDGGGIIGFGASDFDAFPKGTYNFDLLCSQLRANPIAVGEVGVTCNIVHLSKDTESHESFLLNRATVRGWFEIAHNCPRTFGDRVDKIWELKPPLETRKD